MIEEVTESNFNEVLPLIKEYQEFYGVPEIDEEKNKRYFSQFLGKNINGVLHLYRAEGRAVGFTTIYRGYSSTRAEEVAILNDLFVSPDYRGRGYAKQLISHAIEEAKGRGFYRIQWLTAKSNMEAQNLYSSLGANKSEWFFYAKET